MKRLVTRSMPRFWPWPTEVSNHHRCSVSLKSTLSGWRRRVGGLYSPFKESRWQPVWKWQEMTVTKKIEKICLGLWRVRECWHNIFTQYDDVDSIPIDYQITIVVQELIHSHQTQNRSMSVNSGHALFNQSVLFSGGSNGGTCAKTCHDLNRPRLNYAEDRKLDLCRVAFDDVRQNNSDMLFFIDIYSFCSWTYRS